MIGGIVGRRDMEAEAKGINIKFEAQRNLSVITVVELQMDL
jgi:hypothetical protein